MIKRQKQWLLMFKIIFLFLFIVSSLFALGDDVKILADSVKGKGNVLYATGNVVVYSDKYVITADKAEYNKNTKTVKLYGNINLIRDSNLFAKSKYAKINLSNNSSFFNPFFLDDAKTDIWIRSKNAKVEDDVYYTRKAIVSSCNVYKPDWKITYSSGDYSKNTKYVTLYNALFYIKGVPLFYTPYFRFSTDKTRKSGLLRPSFGYSSGEGLYYMQPIYFAPFKSWDFELDPQIRSKRGEGLYGNLRFADSAYSKGNITLGEFKEKKSFAKRYNLKNNSHYGYEINYNRSKLFSGYFGDESQDGLLIDYKYLNDVDYLNLQKNRNYMTSSLITSKINYFLRRDKDYVGLYFKYFKDTNKVSNDDTLQTLPKFQYHRFTEPILFKNLLYSVDYKFNNYYRKTGINARQNEILAPLTFTLPLLDNYLEFSASENLYLTRINYSNGSNSLPNGQYISNYHKFSLSTNLIKKYNNFLHTVNVSIDYILPSFNDKKGYFADFVTLNKEQKSVNFQLEEFFYNNKGDLFLTHRMSQSYLFDNYDYKYGDLLNELIYNFSNKLSITNNLTYSHKYSRISEFQTGITYMGNTYQASLLHTYKHGPDIGDSNLISINASTTYFSRYNYFTNIDYDIKKNYIQNWELGVIMKKKCWDYKVSYKQQVTPILTSGGSNSVKRRGIYLTINFTPIGGINYKFEKDSGQSEQ
jgi:LPS-assembly protein